MRAWGARLEVQGEIIHTASTLLWSWAVSATGNRGCRYWVLHRDIVLLTVSRVCAGDALCGDRTAVLGGTGVKGVVDPGPRLGDR